MPPSETTEQQHHNDDPRPLIDKPFDQLTPGEKMMREMEEADAALAHSLATQSQLPAQASYPQNYTHLQHTPQLTASLSETAEHCIVGILRVVLPLVEGLDPVVAITFGAAHARRRAHLSTRLDYYSSNIAGLGWDCGYRNIQTIFSALLYDPTCRHVIAQSEIKEVPSVLEIGAGIEDAWRKGHDQEGAAKMDGKLVDREVWIGAMDVQSYLRNLRINAMVADFETPTVAERTAMFEWIYEQFEYWCDGHCPVHRQRRKMDGATATTHSSLLVPMFCQWMGHSITIIGVTKSRMGEVSLIVLDPSRGFNESLKNVQSLRLDLFQRGVNHHSMQHPRFQLVYIPSRPRNPQNANGSSRSNATNRQPSNDVSNNNNGQAEGASGNVDNNNGGVERTEGANGGGKGFLRSLWFGKR